MKEKVITGQSKHKRTTNKAINEMSDHDAYQLLMGLVDDIKSHKPHLFPNDAGGENPSQSGDLVGIILLCPDSLSPVGGKDD